MRRINWMQEGMLRAVELTEDPSLYVQQALIRLKHREKPQKLVHLWKQIFQNTQSLRSVFLKNGQGYLQSVVQDIELPCFIYSWKDVDDSGFESRLAQVLKEDLALGIDCNETPLCRLLLFDGKDKSLMCFTHHHLLLDGWSFGLVLRDLLNLFKGNEIQELSLLKEESEKSKLSNFIPSIFQDWKEPVQLISMQQQGAIESEREIPGEPLEKLQAEHGITASSILFGLWSIYSSYVAGRRVLSCGMVSSGRDSLSKEQANSVADMLISTHAIPVVLKKEKPFLQWVFALQDRIFSIREKEDLPIPELSELLNVNASSLLRTLFVFENFPLSLNGAEEILESVEMPGSTDSPLCLAVEPKGSAYIIKLLARREYFNEESLFIIMEGFQALVLQFFKYEDSGVNELEEFISKWFCQCYQNLSYSNWLRGPKGAINWDIPHSSFILEDEEGNLSSSELECLVQAQMELLSMNTSQGDWVFLIMEQGRYLTSCMLACLRMGRGFVPLEVDTPGNRLKEMINQLSPSLILISDPELCLDEELVSMCSKDIFYAQTREYSPENAAAYCIFTSGSTGKPKGVIISQQALFYAVSQLNESFHTGDKRLMITSPNGFDITVYSCLGPVLSGGVSLCVNSSIRTNSQLLFAEIMTRSAEFLVSTPAQMAQLKEIASIEDLQCSSLNTVFMGGERIPPQLNSSLRQWFPEADFFACGGATETSMITNWHKIVEGMEYKNIPYGKPIPGARYYVLDENLRHCPPMIPGELYVSGTCLADCYFGESKKTALSFVPDPFSKESGSRMYRTGDAGRWLSDGELEILGRVDEQIKIRGVRIEPEEVESAILKLVGVNQVIVFAEEFHDSEKILLAFYTGSGVQDNWKQSLSDSLLSAMIPECLIQVSKFPLTDNGKIDRQALGKQYKSKGARDVIESGLTETGEKLKALFSEILGKNISSEECFLASGGHSLKQVRLLALLQENGFSVSLKELLTHSSVRTLEKLLKNREQKSGQKKDDCSQNRWFPLYDLQNGMLFFHEFQKELDPYEIHFGLEFSEQPDVNRLKKAIEKILQTRDVFSASLSYFNGKPGLIFDSERSPALSGDINSSMDLLQPPLLRWEMKSEGSKFLLNFKTHHLVMDGYSISLFYQDLQKFYQSEAYGIETDFPSYKTWLARRRDSAQDQPLWLEKLKHCQRLSLPTGTAGNKGGCFCFYLEGKQLDAMESFSIEAGCTIFEFLLFHFLKILSEHTGQKHILLGVSDSGRIAPKEHAIMGMMVKELPLSFHINDNDRSVLKGICEEVRWGRTHGNFDYQKLVQQLNWERASDGNPLYPVHMNYGFMETKNLSFEGVSVRAIDKQGAGGQFPFSIHLLHTSEGLEISGNWSALVCEQFARRVLKQYEEALTENS